MYEILTKIDMHIFEYTVEKLWCTRCVSHWVYSNSNLGIIAPYASCICVYSNTLCLFQVRNPVRWVKNLNINDLQTYKLILKCTSSSLWTRPIRSARTLSAGVSRLPPFLHVRGVLDPAPRALVYRVQRDEGPRGACRRLERFLTQREAIARIILGSATWRMKRIKVTFYSIE